MRYALVAIMLVVATLASAFEGKAFVMREGFDPEPLYDCALQYYYYIPCPTYSWFWCLFGWERGDVLGAWFTVGDNSTGGYEACDPGACMALESFVVLDFAGYGTLYPWDYTVKFEVWCADEYGCPVGPVLWSSGPYETHLGWNHVYVDPPLSVCDCVVNPEPPSAPRFLITAKHIGIYADYPAWGFDNISYSLQQGCELHDISSLPVLYPRPYNSYCSTIHSGFYAREDFMYCPGSPIWFKDLYDTTAAGTHYGYMELAWRAYLLCGGPSRTEATTWSKVKALYR